MPQAAIASLRGTFGVVSSTGGGLAPTLGTQELLAAGTGPRRSRQAEDRDAGHAAMRFAAIRQRASLVFSSRSGRPPRSFANRRPAALGVDGYAADIR